MKDLGAVSVCKKHSNSTSKAIKNGTENQYNLVTVKENKTV